MEILVLCKADTTDQDCKLPLQANTGKKARNNAGLKNLMNDLQIILFKTAVVKPTVLQSAFQDMRDEIAEDNKQEVQ